MNAPTWYTTVPNNLVADTNTVPNYQWYYQYPPECGTSNHNFVQIQNTKIGKHGLYCTKCGKVLWIDEEQ